MTKWKGKAASLAPFLLLATVSAVALDVRAALADVTIGTAEGPQTIGNETLTILPEGSVTGNGSPNAFGIDVTLDYSSELLNQGLIDVDALGTGVAGPVSINGDATALGIAFQQDLEFDGSLINAGDLLVSAIGGSTADAFASVAANVFTQAAAGDAFAKGVLIGEDLDGSLVNEGTVEVLARAGHDSFASAIANGPAVADTSLNAGASVRAGVAEAIGIHVMEDLRGSIVNNGTITIGATGSDLSSALAIVGQSGLTASGAAQGTALARATVIAGNASAVAVKIEGDAEGSLANSGTVTVIATAGDLAIAEASFLSLFASADLGAKATALVNAAAGDVTAAWIFAGGDAGTITNSGTISIAAIGVTRLSSLGDTRPSAYAQTSGVIASGDSPEARALVHARAGSALAQGVSAAGSIASLANSGTITIDSLGGDFGVARVVLNSVKAQGSGGSNHATAIQSANAYAGVARAYGVIAGVDEALDGSIAALSNSGTIRVTAAAGEQGRASATAGGALASHASSLNVSVLAHAHAGLAEAAGVSAADDIGSLSNSGQIIVSALGGNRSLAVASAAAATATTGTTSVHVLISALASAGVAAAVGVNAGGDLTGTLANSGSIVVTATGGTFDPTFTSNPTPLNGAYAALGQVFTSYVDTATTAAATGHVSAVAGVATALGVKLGGDLSGSLSNSGSISVSATGSTDARASAEGTQLTATATGLTLAQGTARAFAGNAYAAGVSIGDDATGDLSNSGTISVEAAGGDFGQASASVSGMAASFEADARAEAGNAEARGVTIGGDLRGTLVNSGSISVSATGGNWNTAEAMANGSPGRSSSGAALAQGITVEGSVESRLANSGSISVSAAGGQDNLVNGNSRADASAYGIRIGTGLLSGAELAQSGAIFAEATAFEAADAEAYGLYVADMAAGSTVSVNGRVVARVTDADNSGKTVADDAYAIWLNGDAGELKIGPPSFLEGQLRVTSQDVSLTSGPGLSVSWTFQDDAPGSGDFNLQGSLPWFVKNGGTGSPAYATYDPTGLAAQSNIIADLAGLVSRLGSFGIAQAESLGKHLWITGASSQRSYDGSDSTLDQDIASNAVAAGASFDASGDIRLTAFGGYNWGSMTAEGADADNADPDENDLSGFFGGIFGRWTHDMFRLGGGVSGGSISQETTRTINNNLVWGGIEKARSESNGYWVSPEVSASVSYAVNEHVALRPTLTGRYVFGQIGGYDETGSESAAEVSDQSVGVVEIDANAMVDINFDWGLLSLGGGYLFRRDTGDDEVDVAIFGVSQGVAVDSADGSAPYAQADFTLGVVDNISLIVSGRMVFPEDGGIGTDALLRLQVNF